MWVAYEADLPLCDSRQELFERLRLKIGRDLRFRTKYEGWKFAVARFDDQMVLRGGRLEPCK